MNNSFFSQISDDDFMLNRFEIMSTDDGFMPYDHDCDEYLYDEHKNNCFDNYWDAAKLVQDAIISIQENQ
jgi:hypothetical protein